MNVPVARPAAVLFVTAVRAQLDDLTAEEVVELTGGLEADLDDALADQGRSPAGQFGDPVAYAAELRAAAGLPPRAVPGGRRGAAGLPGVIRRAWGRGERALATARGHRWWPGVSDFALTLRPVWWTVRALVAFSAVQAFLGMSGDQVPHSLVALLLLAACVVISVELGRRHAAGRGRWQRGLIGAGNVLAAVLFLPVLAGALTPSTSVNEVPYAVPPENGLWLDGVEVRNVFPYDAQGRPLTGVQLYDENGRPVAVGTSAQTPLTDDGHGVTVGQVPAVDAASRQLWNVYPLRQRVESTTDPTSGEVRDVVSSPTPAPLPGVAPPVLLAPVAGEAGPPSGPSSSPGPTAGPTP